MTLSSPAHGPESEPMDLEPALDLMTQAMSAGDLAELERLLSLPKRLPPWANSQEFTRGQGRATHQALATSWDHPMSLAAREGDAEALALFLPHASPWVKATALEVAAQARASQAFDMILGAIELRPTPPDGWPERSHATGVYYGETPEEKIAIYPFGDALAICVGRGFGHGVRGLVAKVKGDAWEEADRLMSHRTMAIGISWLPESLDAVCALLPALSLGRVLTELRLAKIDRKKERARGHARSDPAAAQEAFEALCAVAEGLAIQRSIGEPETDSEPLAAPARPRL